MEPKKSTPAVVHESEAQRQHVRVQIPAQAEIAGKRYEVRDLSVGGVSLVGVIGSFRKNDSVAVNLVLPFGDFSLDVSLDSKVQHYDADARSLGLRFDNLTPVQVSILSHVLKAFLAGDIVESGDILAVAARDNFVKVRKQKGASDQKADFDIRRQLPGLLLIGTLGLIAAFLILNSLFERVFVLKSNQGAVVGPVVQLAAPSAGLVKRLVPANTVAVKIGQPLFSIETSIDTTGAAAQPATIVSPCECFLSQSRAQSGEYVQTGAPVMDLIPVSAEPMIVMTLEPRDADRVVIDGRVSIRIPGANEIIQGKVVQIETNLASVLASRPSETFGAMPAFPSVVARIRPDQKLPAGLIGRPAYAEFKTY